MTEERKKHIAKLLVDMSLVKVGVASGMAYLTARKARDGGNVMPVVWDKLDVYFKGRVE